MRGHAVVVCLILVASAGRGAPSAFTPFPEYRLKAAFVSKFPSFASWPDSALANRTAVEVCVARPNPFGQSLDELLVGERVHGKPLVVRTVDGPEAVTTCHVLFVTHVGFNERRAFLAKVATLPVLTVGDYPTFLDEGGIVNLRLVDGRIRFDIDLGAANRAGLRLSSQLLQLAFSTRGGPE